ncbi:MAG: MiaB/RimO family radical SAM methylthiotransferase, partial [bacterium]
VKIVLPARELDDFENRMIAAMPGLVGDFEKSFTEPILRHEEKFERFVPIIRGCINACSYCIVPTARGSELISRPPDEIFREVKTLIDAGVMSITFLGQNVCAYGHEIRSIANDPPPGWENFPKGYGFVELLSDIRERFGGENIWFKFLTSHPKDVSDGLIDVVGSHTSFSRHFHLPLQAGDDEILQRMARGYLSGYYEDLIGRIRKKLPDMRLSTDLIVGFPGEDEHAFENTLEMVKKIGFDSAFTFLYSPRKGTPAEKWEDPVPLAEKKTRLQTLIELQNRIALERAQSHVGENRTVLAEDFATGSKSRSDRMVTGHTREEEMVILEGTHDDFGSRIEVKLIDANLRSFRGERK